MKTMTPKEIKDEIFRLMDKVGMLAEKAYQAHLKAAQKAQKKEAA